ncbi:hypothetical protein [Croceimicrobium sp.]|uniref:hypothetical protein n=1 Tax=Croceimicrobium sp. TaxID=2828340 RepID=UPI003BAA68FC
MIVQSKIDNGLKQADIPQGLEYESATYRPSTDDYVIKFTPEQEEANRITPAQGRAQLDRDGLLSDISNHIEQSSNTELRIFWEYSTYWDRTTPTIQALASGFGIDLSQFWKKAKKIQL